VINMLAKGNTLNSKDIHNILLIQLGDIGDVVWATPTFRAVKETYPKANVSVLLRQDIGSLLEADPHIHRLFEVKRSRGNFINKVKEQYRLLRALHKERFDLVFDLRLDDRGAFMAFLSGAAVRVAKTCPGVLWRNRLFTHIVVPPAHKERIFGAAEQSLRLVREFGIDTKDTTPKLWVSEKVKRQAEKVLEGYNITTFRRWITLNPFSRWLYKEWGYEKWVHIVEWLWEEYEIPTVIVGASEERERAIIIADKCKGRIFNLAGKTTLDELAALLRLSSLHVGVDSAPPHIAAAVGTPTITIFGPSDWRDWAPRGKIHSVVTPDRDCVPCHQKGCDGSGISRCFETLKVEKVKRAVRIFLENSPRL
jgi:predicted lipopolysaccharide heptosyltransferase III